MLCLVDVSPWAWALLGGGRRLISPRRHLPQNTCLRPDIVLCSRLPHAHEQLIAFHTTSPLSHSIFYALQYATMNVLKLQKSVPSLLFTLVGRPGLTMRA